MTTIAQAPGRLRMTPGRRAALALGVPLALILIAWTGFSWVAFIGQASFRVGYDIPVTKGRLSLSTGGGNLTLLEGQGRTARLTGTVQYSLVRPNVTETTTAAGTTINADCTGIAHAQGNCELDATLTVPPRTAVALSSGGGDLSVSRVDTGLTLTSGGGNVAVSGGTGAVSASTGGGDVTADNLAGVLSFSTGGGNVNGSALKSANVTAWSSGGDVALTFAKPPANLVITSGGGNITVTLPPDGSLGYALTASTGGGSLSDPIHLNTSSPYKITASSGGGDITITEAG